MEHGIILVPEGRRLFGGLTVMENLEIGAYSKRAREVRANTFKLVFELFPLLADRRLQRANTMSGGQQQMLAVGRALMGVPRLLMLDEPSLGLAPIVVEQIFETLQRLNQQGVTIFLVEQNARQALELADRAYILEQGRIVGTGSRAGTAERRPSTRSLPGHLPGAGGLIRGRSDPSYRPSSSASSPVRSMAWPRWVWPWSSE